MHPLRSGLVLTGLPHTPPFGLSVGQRVSVSPGAVAGAWPGHTGLPAACGLTALCPCSTELMRRVQRFQIAQYKCLVIKYAKDTRYSTKFSTHDRSVPPPPAWDEVFPGALARGS